MFCPLRDLGWNPTPDPTNLDQQMLSPYGGSCAVDDYLIKREMVPDGCLVILSRS